MMTAERIRYQPTPQPLPRRDPSRAPAKRPRSRRALVMLPLLIACVLAFTLGMNTVWQTSEITANAKRIDELNARIEDKKKRAGEIEAKLAATIGAEEIGAIATGKLHMVHPEADQIIRIAAPEVYGEGQQERNTNWFTRLLGW